MLEYIFKNVINPVFDKTVRCQGEELHSDGIGKTKHKKKRGTKIKLEKWISIFVKKMDTCFCFIK